MHHTTYDHQGKPERTQVHEQALARKKPMLNTDMLLPVAIMLVVIVGGLFSIKFFASFTN